MAYRIGGGALLVSGGVAYGHLTQRTKEAVIYTVGATLATYAADSLFGKVGFTVITVLSIGCMAYKSYRVFDTWRLELQQQIQGRRLQGRVHNVQVSVMLPESPPAA